MITTIGNLRHPLVHWLIITCRQGDTLQNFVLWVTFSDEILLDVLILIYITGHRHKLGILICWRYWVVTAESSSAIYQSRYELSESPSHQVMNGCHHIYIIQTCGTNVWEMWLDKLYCLQGRAALTSRVTSTSPPRTFWTTSAGRTLVRQPCISDIYLFIYSLLLFTYLLSSYYPCCWKQTLKIERIFLLYKV